MRRHKINLSEARLNKIINESINHVLVSKTRRQTLSESRINNIIDRCLGNVINEARNGEGSLSYLATELISNNAAALNQFDSLGEMKSFIENKVNRLTKTTKEQKYRFLYGDGTRSYGGLMGAKSVNQLLVILGKMAIGDNGLGLKRNGMA